MKKVIILGAGESGLGSAELAKKNFFEVFVSDYGKIKYTKEFLKGVDGIDLDLEIDTKKTSTK